MELEMRENLPAKKRCKDVVEIAKKLSKFSSSYIIYKKIDRKYYLTWAQYGNVENSVRSILNSSLLKFYKNPVIEIPLTVGCYVLSPTTGSVLCGRVTRVTDAVAVCIVYGIVTAKVYWTADGPSNVNLGDCIWFELTNYYSEHKYLVFEGNLVSENTATTKGCLEKFGYEADLMVGSWTTDNASRSYSGSKKIKFVDEENKTDVSSFDFTMPSSSSAFKKAEFKTASSLKEKLKTSSTDTNDIDEMKILSFEDSGCTPDAETSTSEKVNEPKNHKKKNQKLDSDALLLENMNETNCDDDHEEGLQGNIITPTKPSIDGYSYGLKLRELLKAHILGTGEEHVSEEAALTNGDDDLEKLNDTDTKLKKHKKKRKHNESPLPESSFRMQVNSESVDIINRILKMGAVNSNSDLIQSVVEEDVAKKMHEPKRKKIKMEI
ncbi:Mitogen-activated protein kinase [Trichinella spiralis]|uniref:Mitogen-activated protein kinase n=1 Tax=Trichinella spiralis TaxID=6334 RepID=A0ABR3KWP1_TRISP